ncbi:glycosyltransferase [Parablautia muri]|uniref:Glycosyltransferase n=1 Tax=Parablautia muri TaxID=2320879 RepID=A0A9X5GSE6_9FIRM|nr:glycosyltransferase [Parablautia muri]NBJ94043.1 glycosyltransferase [Parablautia muri]
MNKISVLMCVYDTPVNYLQEAIDSILNQNFSEWEMIIVDDGSNQQTVEVLKKYAKKNNQIKIIRNKQNLGLTKSLNIGLKKCSGRYIARMDSDDISLVDRLNRQYKYMEEHQEVDVLGVNVENFGDKSIYQPKFRNYMNDTNVFRVKMLFNNVGPRHPSVMIRKSFLDENNILYQEKMVKAQDYALWVDCIEAGAIFACLNEKLLLYRIHKEQITTSAHGEQSQYLKKIIQGNLMKIFGIEQEGAEVLSTLYSDKFEFTVEKYIFWIDYLSKTNRIYSPTIFDNELKERWIHKVIKCAKYSKDYRGLKYIFTLRCVFSKSLFSWIRYSFL